MDDQPSRVTENPENLPGAMFGVPQLNKYLGKMPNFYINFVSMWFLLEINKNKLSIAINFLVIEWRSSSRGCRSSPGSSDFSAISLQNFTKLTGFNLDRCPNLSVKGHQNRTSLWLFF